MRLWLSYQRYALLGAATIVGAGAAAVALDHAWWAWLLALALTAGLLPLVVQVWRDLPRKRRATELATRRIAAGTFRPESLQGHCGDPCWRIVAAEILRRADLPRAERRRVLSHLRARYEAEAHSLLIIDHENGTLVHVEGDVTVRTSFPRTTS